MAIFDKVDYIEIEPPLLTDDVELGIAEHTARTRDPGYSHLRDIQEHHEPGDQLVRHTATEHRVC